MSNYRIFVNRTFLVGLIAVLLACPTLNVKADIFQTSQNTTFDVNGVVYGQSFTADSSVANLTNFLFVISNNAPGVTATGKLYAGTGYGGTLLDTETAFFSSILPTNSPLTFNFSGNSLTNGSVYTVQVTSNALLELRASNSNPYSDGAMLDATGSPLSNDFQFFVEGTPAAVPEPAALGLLAAGATMMLFRRRPSNG